MHAANDWLDILLSIPAFLLWFGPLVIALAWGAWRSLHGAHPIDHASPSPALATAPTGPPSSIRPLAHG